MDEQSFIRFFMINQYEIDSPSKLFHNVNIQFQEVYFII